MPTPCDALRSLPQARLGVNACPHRTSARETSSWTAGLIESPTSAPSRSNAGRVRPEGSQNRRTRHRRHEIESECASATAGHCHNRRRRSKLGQKVPPRVTFAASCILHLALQEIKEHSLICTLRRVSVACAALVESHSPHAACDRRTCTALYMSESLGLLSLRLSCRVGRVWPHFKH